MERLAPNIFWILCLCSLTIGIAACNVSTPPNSNQLVGAINIIEAIEVDSVIADFPVGFNFLTLGEWQFIGYYNKNRELTVASRKISDQRWKYQILPTKVGWDSHNRISMTTDRDSCLHISGNMHNDTLIYFKTDRPNDISTFKEVFPMVAAADESRCTYPKFTKNAANELIYSYRKGGSGNGITISNLYDEQSKSFRRLTDKPLFDGLGLMSAYARGPRLGPDKFFHMIWFWRDTPACETNHDLSYARSRDLIHWETVDGHPIALPITPDIHQLTVDPVPPGGGVINGGAMLFFDAEDKPIIAYMKYDSAGISQIFIARQQVGEWLVKQVSNWAYRWEFSGPGSIEFHISIHKGDLDPDGNIVITYTHIKRGNGELIIDPNTFSLIADRPLQIVEQAEYPAELLTPTSGIDSVSVRWLSPASKQANEYYALRWETMGKRRFYKPRQVPIKPSVLTLYKFERRTEDR